MFSFLQPKEAKSSVPQSMIMNLYYNVVDNYLQIFNNNGKYLFSIKCKNGESILILLEDYLEKNNIELVFDQLIPL